MKLLLLLGTAVAVTNVAAAPDQSLHAHRFSNAVTNDQKYSPTHKGDRSALTVEVASTGSDAYLGAFSDALAVMQDSWFQLWIGIWPTAIDWTAAVISRYIISALESLHVSASSSDTTPVNVIRSGDRIAGYFAQIAAFYFGENAFALRNEANDDVLWVVLNWVEGIRFAKSYSSTFRLQSGGMPWHGVQYVPAFAHRARIFYEISTKGWDTTLCGGGMVWNNNLEPYKNAITNELYISASTEMYLEYSGDDNNSPYITHSDGHGSGAFNRSYLDNAVQAYHWLKDSDMFNTHGLYVDGYHITGYRNKTNIGTGKCDARNEMVYTYNQGVILTGSRNLWESTGDIQYLMDAHALVRNVIAATGWDGPDNPLNLTWAGIGRAGILEEFCDASGSCTQDGQTFKGIFMEHLAHFCQPLPRVARHRGITFPASYTWATLHRNSCRSYAGWVFHNANAANSTRNADGKFGMWWGASYYDSTGIAGMVAELPVGAVDHVNDHNRAPIGERSGITAEPDPTGGFQLSIEKEQTARNEHVRDANDRGRGRTVETQGGGLAVMRAAWEFSRLK